MYRRNPDIVALLPRQKGQRLGNRRLKPDSERLLGEVIDVWAARAERLPVSWIVEECRRLIHQGYKEITLLGQNVNSFGKDKPEWNCLFHDLLYRIDVPHMATLQLDLTPAGFWDSATVLLPSSCIAPEVACSGAMSGPEVGTAGRPE